MPPLFAFSRRLFAVEKYVPDLAELGNVVKPTRRRQLNRRCLLRRTRLAHLVPL
jgi:hypothetical protein